VQLSDAERTAIFDAASRAVPFNAPLGPGRSVDLVDAVSTTAPATVVDLGCGTGAIAQMVAESNPDGSVLGIDSNSVSVAAARARSAGSTNLSFEVGDASLWAGPSNAAICIGASHIFGASCDMFTALAAGVPCGVAVVGDAYWQRKPTAWCLEAFGELPSSLHEVLVAAENSGWQVTSIDSSTTEEWDAFEQAWIAGARAVDSRVAQNFADQRARDYEHYRGVLGFAWLIVERSPKLA